MLRIWLIVLRVKRICWQAIKAFLDNKIWKLWSLDAFFATWDILIWKLMWYVCSMLSRINSKHAFQ